MSELSEHQVDSPGAVHGRIVQAEIKVTTDPIRPLPLGCALYAIEDAKGVWLCAYYGQNRSVFDFLPQMGMEVDETKLGIVFQEKQLIPTETYGPTVWEDFKKSNLMMFEAHKG